MNDIEQIRQALKLRRNPLWKKTDRKMALIMLLTTMPMFMISLAGGIVFNNTIMTLGPLFALLFIFPTVSRMVTKKYWRCPECRNALPDTWIGIKSTWSTGVGCIPVYVEICPWCGFNLVGGKPPLTETEIAEDNRKRKRIIAGILGVLGFVLFIEFLIVLVWVKKGMI